MIKKVLMCAALFVGALGSGTGYAESLDAVMARCAPGVHPTTLLAIIRTESSGNALALTDDGIAGRSWAERKKTIRSFAPSTAAEAESMASRLIEQGHVVDIGLTQVSSRNLGHFGLSVHDALDTCTNIATGAKILTQFYGNARSQFSDSAAALLAAISAYNTGNFRDGFSNGYVSRVLEAGQAPTPARLTFGGAERAGAQRAARSLESPRLLSQRFSVLAVVPD